MKTERRMKKLDEEAVSEGSYLLSSSGLAGRVQG